MDSLNPWLDGSAYRSRPETGSSRRASQFPPPAWRERSREGAIEVPAGRQLVIVEGVGAARRELTALLDVVVRVQSDMVEAERRGIERDGGDEAAASFWHLWMAEELPFMAQAATLGMGSLHRRWHAAAPSRPG